MANMTDDDIRLRAYQIWEEEGRPEGRDIEHWQRALAEASASDTDEGQDSTSRVENDVGPSALAGRVSQSQQRGDSK